MANPLIVMAMSQLQNEASAIGSSVIAPINYSISLSAWYAQSRKVPDRNDLIQAFLSGFIDDGAMQEWMKWNGTIWAPTQDAVFEETQRLVPDWQARQEIWQRVVDSKKIRPPISTAVDLWMRSQVDDNEFKRIVKQAGGDVDAWWGLRNAWFTPMSAGDINVARNRELINANEYNDALKRAGYRTPRSRELIDKLRLVMPTISDLVQFGVKDLWDENVVRARKLFDEAPWQMIENMKLQGLRGDSGVTPPANFNGEPVTWPYLYWGQHWQNISASQAYEMYFRLRTNRLHRYTNQGLNVTEYTLDHLRQQLKVNDYAPGDRDYLAAISNTPLSLRVINSTLATKAQLDINPTMAAAISPDIIARLQVVDRQWAIEQYLDRGYHEDDAEVAADVSLVQASVAANRQLLNYQRSLVAKQIVSLKANYAAGISAGPFTRNRLVALGLTIAAAQQTTDLIDAERKQKETAYALKYLRHDYLAGMMTLDEVSRGLDNMQLTAETQQHLRDLWRSQFTMTRKAVTAAKVLEWFTHGLIDEQEATKRLRNLGYSEPDQVLMLRQAQQNVYKLQVGQVAAFQRTANQRAHAMEKVAKDARKAQRDAVKEMRAAMPKATLLAALRKGTLTRPYVQARLRAQGYPEDQIQVEIATALAPPVREKVADIVAKREAEALTALPPPPPPPPPPAVNP